MYVHVYSCIEVLHINGNNNNSIRASTRQHTIIGYVQNGYYPDMKYSIRILHKMRG